MYKLMHFKSTVFAFVNRTTQVVNFLRAFWRRNWSEFYRSWLPSTRSVVLKSQTRWWNVSWRQESWSTTIDDCEHSWRKQQLLNEKDTKAGCSVGLDVKLCEIISGACIYKCIIMRGCVCVRVCVCIHASVCVCVCVCVCICCMWPFTGH